MAIQKEFHQLHVSIPIEIWEEFKEVAPEYGVTSVIIKRLIIAYIKWIKEGKETINFKNITL